YVDIANAIVGLSGKFRDAVVEDCLVGIERLLHGFALAIETLLQRQGKRNAGEGLIALIRQLGSGSGCEIAGTITACAARAFVEGDDLVEPEVAALGIPGTRI